MTNVRRQQSKLGGPSQNLEVKATAVPSFLAVATTLAYICTLSSSSMSSTSAQARRPRLVIKFPQKHQHAACAAKRVLSVLDNDESSKKSRLLPPQPVAWPSSYTVMGVFGPSPFAAHSQVRRVVVPALLCCISTTPSACKTYSGDTLLAAVVVCHHRRHGLQMWMNTTAADAAAAANDWPWS